MTRGELHFGGSAVKVWIDAQDGEIRASSVRPKDSIRFLDFVARYQTEVVSQMKPASQASVKSCLGVLSEHFGSKKLADIGTEEIQRFVTGSPYAAKTVKNLIGVFRMVWNKARAWNYVKTNPFEFLAMPRSPLKTVRYLSVEDCRAIIRKTDMPWRAMFMILAETGIRGGELVALAREDVDLEARIIRIRRSAYQGVLQTPKTGNAIRSIAISGRLAGELSSLAGRKLGSSPTAGMGPVSSSEQSARTPANSLLFPAPDGRPYYNYHIVRDILKPVLAELGIAGEHLGLHAFRHFNASIMASLGVPEHIRRERLGHSGSGVTAGYTHSSPADHRKWAEVIGQACTENGYSMSATIGGD